MDIGVKGCGALAGAGRAQGLVVLHGKGAGRDGSAAFLALEACAVPLGIEGHDRVLRDRLTTSGAAGGEELLEVRPAVGMSLPLVEGGAHQRLLAGAVAHEALLVPRLPHGLYGALQDGLLASEARVRVVLHEAVGADGLVRLDVEGGLRDGPLAVLAGEVLRVPGLAQRRDDALLDDLIALVTDGLGLRHVA